MRNFLILIILLGVAYYLYTRDNPNAFKFSASAPVIEASGGSSHDFNTVSAQLEQDLQNLPPTLDGDAPRPVHAIDVKRRLRPHLNLHQEYEVLTHVCDLIIQADTERTSLQQSSRAEQSRTTYHSPLEQISPQKKAALPDTSAQQGAIHQRMDGTWGEYRARTADEVERLLGTLKGKKI